MADTTPLPERRRAGVDLRNALHDVITELQRQYAEVPAIPHDGDLTNLAVRTADAEYVLKILRLHV